MPQFDISSFLVQLIWLFFALIGFHTLLCLHFLPVTSQYIKARKSLNYSIKYINYSQLVMKSKVFGINTKFQKSIIFC